MTTFTSTTPPATFAVLLLPELVLEIAEYLDYVDFQAFRHTDTSTYRLLTSDKLITKYPLTSEESVLMDYFGTGLATGFPSEHGDLINEFFRRLRFRIKPCEPTLPLHPVSLGPVAYRAVGILRYEFFFSCECVLVVHGRPPAYPNATYTKVVGYQFFVCAECIHSPRSYRQSFPLRFISAHLSPLTIHLRRRNLWESMLKLKEQPGEAKDRFSEDYRFFADDDFLDLAFASLKHMELSPAVVKFIRRFRVEVHYHRSFMSIGTISACAMVDRHLGSIATMMQERKKKKDNEPLQAGWDSEAQKYVLVVLEFHKMVKQLWAVIEREYFPTIWLLDSNFIS